ncbi:MAG: hypothetical protein Kow0068_17920 [Marinilabiliales bacterium]
MTDKDKEISALISLIDDPNAEIYKLVEEKLINRGKDIIDILEDAWESAQNSVVQERVENIIQKIQFSEIYNNIKEWLNSEENELLTGAFYIAKIHYPNIEFDDIIKKYDIIKQDIWLEINNNLTALEKVKILNHIIFEIHKFTKTSDEEDFYAISNCMINTVLDTKKGNPISLGILYASLAQDLNLPVYGVNLPKNFVLGYKDASEFTRFEDDFTNDVLFYINPFNKGAVFGKREIDYYLKQMKITPEKSHYKLCSNIETIERLILTLMHSYKLSNNTARIEQMKSVLKLFNEKLSRQ